MIVTCQTCVTRYRLDENRLKPGGSKVRCSKCGETFLVAAPPPAGEPVLADIAQTARYTSEAPSNREGLGRTILILFVLAALGAAVVYYLVTDLEVSSLQHNKAVEFTSEQVKRKGEDQTSTQTQTSTAALDKTATETEPVITTPAAKLTDVQHHFVENAIAGQLLVINGLVTVAPGAAPAPQMIRAALFDRSGQQVDEKEFFIGHQLMDFQLTTLPMAALMDKLTMAPDLLPVDSAERMPFTLVFAQQDTIIDEFTLELIEKIPDK
jgi:predicted Zn finger-like uncharacterized protein